MDTNGSKTKGTIHATKRSFEILEELQRRSGAGVTELAEELEYSKSTIHEHLKTLLEIGYVEQDGSGYRIGLRFLTLGGYVQKNENLYRLSKLEIEELVEEIGESVQLAVENHGKALYLYQVRGDRAIQTDSHIGTRVYLHMTAVGKVILAYLPPKRVDQIIDKHGLPAHTSNTITDRSTLSDTLDEIRERGYALDDEERIEGIRCVAVPIIYDNSILGAISISGPAKRIDNTLYYEELPTLLQDTARIIEIKVQYS